MFYKSIFVMFLVIVFLLFKGCSKETTIVLLDSGKSQNTVLVSTEKGGAKLDKVGAFVDLKDKKKAPSKVKTMSKEEINSRFGKVLAMSPAKPVKYILYFKPNSIELTEKSTMDLEEAIKTMKKRSPCTVDIIGHTDSVGSSAKNIEVSLKRAKHVTALVKKRDVKVVSLTSKGYGEEDLLIKTADNVSEVRNRNVEVFIK